MVDGLTSSTRSPDIPTIIYVVGAGRSGSTLVERLLGSQAGFVNVGELMSVFSSGVLWNERCGCGEPFDDCALWGRVGTRAFGSWDREAAESMVALRRRLVRQRRAAPLLLGTTNRTSTGLQSELMAYVDTFTRLYAAIGVETGARVIVDASKEPVHAFLLSRLTGLDLRILHLVRDPRGVAFSWAKADVSRPNAGRNRTTMRVYSARETARMWNRANAWGTILRRRRPSALLRYEQFAHDPEAELTTALHRMGFLGAGLGDFALNTAGLPSSHAIGGNPNRFDRGPLRVRLDDQWRLAMPSRDQRLVRVLTAGTQLLLRASDVDQRSASGKLRTSASERSRAE